MKNVEPTAWKNRSIAGKIWFVVRWPFLAIALLLVFCWIGLRLLVKGILEVFFGRI